MDKIKVIIFGSGGLYKKLKCRIFKFYDVVSIYDNDIRKKNTSIDGFLIRHVNDGINEEYQIILVVSMFFFEIKSQLVSMGIDADKVKDIRFDSRIGRDIWHSIYYHEKLKSEVLKNKIKGSILILINSLRPGGAEKALVNFSEFLAGHGIAVNIVSIFGGGIYRDQINSSHVNMELFSQDEYIEASILLNTIPAEEIYVAMIGVSFDIVISFIEGQASLLGSRASARKRISWCHTNLNTYHWTKNAFDSYESEENCYKRFDNIIFVSKSGLEGFCKLFPNVNVCKSVIPNLFNISEIINLSRGDIKFPSFTFITVGRLTQVKGFNRLIDAFFKLHKVIDDVRLVILGEGEERAKLEGKIELLGIADRVNILGFKENPYKYVAAADVYVSSSYTEGQPLSIGEAMILEKPIIATNNSGSSSILNDGAYGLLVENSTQGLYSAMLRIASDPKFLAELKERAKDGISSLSSEKILHDVIDLLSA